MDCQVDDGHIIPLRCRLVCDLKRLPEDFPWPTDADAVLAYTDAERDAIAAALTEIDIPHTAELVDQPDSAHLALCQGKVTSRTEALAALTALSDGLTPKGDKFRLALLEQDVTILKEAKAVPL